MHTQPTTGRIKHTDNDGELFSRLFHCVEQLDPYVSARFISTIFLFHSFF